MTDGQDIRGIVRRARDGDRGAFAELVRLFERKVVSVALQFLGNMDAALEVAQESLVRAFQGLPKLKDPDAFASWLLRIVTNLSLSQLRRKKTSVSTSASLDKTENDAGHAHGDAFPTTHPSNDPAHAAEYSETMVAIDEAIRTLPEKYRTVVILHCVEDVRHDEIAKALGIPVKTVRWRLFQARQILRKKLEEHL